MTLSNLNTAYSDPEFSAAIEEILNEGQEDHANLVSVQINSYEEARDGLIKAEENATLFRSFLTGGGAGGLDRIHNGGGDGNPTFGFGFNLATAVAASHIDELFEHIYNGVLTATQQNAVSMLSAWRMGSSVTITDDNGTLDPSDDVQLQIILTNADIFNGAQLVAFKGRKVKSHKKP